MKKGLRIAAATAACLVLTACPEVKDVTGEAVAIVPLPIPVQWRWAPKKGNTISEGSRVILPPDASITLAWSNENGQECYSQTFTEDFVVPVVDCRGQDSNRKRKSTNEDASEPEPEAEADADAGAAEGSEVSPGISAPDVTPTSVPPYSGSAIDAPAPVATGVPQYTNGIFGPATNLLEVIAGVAVVKRIGDELDDNDHKDNGDQPLSH